MELLREFKEGEFSKIYPTTHFGYRKITVERQLKLNFQITAERIARLDDEPGFQKLATSAKKKEEVRLKEIAAGTERQKAIKEFLTRLAKPTTQKPVTNREEFRDMLKTTARTSNVSLDAIELKAGHECAQRARRIRRAMP